MRTRGALLPLASGKTGVRMLFSLGQQIVYKREIWTRKPMPKSDAQSQWREIEVQHNYIIWMVNSTFNHDGVLPVESHLAVVRVPGPVPQKGPSQETGGLSIPKRGARLQATGPKNSDPAKTTSVIRKHFFQRIKSNSFQTWFPC